MPKSRPKICQNILLVEGKEDLLTIPYLIESHGISWDSDARRAPIWIEQYEGYSNLLQPDVIYTELQSSGLQALGIMIDADEDLANRWQQLRMACLPYISALPNQIPDTGLICNASSGTRFGAWIMPNNQSCGMLETFLSYMIPESGEALWQYSQEVVQEAKKRGALFIDNHLDKANIYTWLAWQKPPGQPFSYALKDRILDPQHSKSQSFVNWFKRLYQL